MRDENHAPTVGVVQLDEFPLRQQLLVGHPSLHGQQPSKDASERGVVAATAPATRRVARWGPADARCTFIWSSCLIGSPYIGYRFLILWLC